MNDRFKFRVWNKNTHSFTTGGAIKFGGLCFVDEEDFGIKLGEHQECYIIEQCTGLKDKNGNLIYIGDIIKCGNGPLNTATVEYANGENFIDGIYPFNLYHDCGDECHCQLRDYPEYACEIIGNIHEKAEQKDK